MIANNFLSRDKRIQEYISLIEDCKMIEPMAKGIFNNNPFSWINIVTKDLMLLLRLTVFQLMPLQRI